MDPIHVLLLSLLTAHLLADFTLQSDRDIALKATPPVFAKHIAIVTLLSWGLAGDWTNWTIPVVIGVSHALLDWGKLAATRRGWNENRLFVWDQVAHIAVILGLVLFHAPGMEYSNALLVEFGDIYLRILLIVSGLVTTVYLGGFIVGKASAGFLQQSVAAPDSDPSREGLRNGGTVIGQLERALIFFFVLIGKPEAVAFLVAAKSIFRFGELTRHSRKEAEYILIGTLMSFGWGLVAAWLTRYLLDSF